MKSNKKFSEDYNDEIAFDEEDLLEKDQKKPKIVYPDIRHQDSDSDSSGV